MYVGFTAAFAEAIKRDEFDLPGSTLESLFGRKPLSLKAFLQTVTLPTNNIERNGNHE